jgi:hypothetical protein
MLALKINDGSLSQEMEVASRNWKIQVAESALLFVGLYYVPQDSAHMFLINT